MISGSIVALITPFTEKGEINEETFCDLILWHIESGTDALVIAGSTGEGASLTAEEKLRLYHLAVETAGGKIPIIAATGTNVTKESVFLTMRAAEIGVDASIAIVPYYNKPSAEGCIAHFTEIASCGLPLILYYHPGRTGKTLTAEELIELSKIQGVCGIKSASGDLTFDTAVRAGATVQLFSGDDSLTLAHLGIGFDGAISVIGNLFPKKWKSMIENRDKALFYRLFPLCQALCKETNPQPVKYAVSLLNRCGPGFRLPLMPPEKELREELAALLDEFSDEPRPTGLVRGA